MAECKSLYDLCRSGDIEEVRSALERGEDANKKLSAKGRTALHVAAVKGHREIVALLLEQPRTDFSVTDDAGWTALHLAAYTGHKEVLISLLSQPGVDVNVANITGSEAYRGATALHIAAQLGHMDILALLINCPGIDLNATSHQGWTALHYAARSSHKDVVALLLNQPGVDVKATTDMGNTALHCACVSGNCGPDLLRCLLANSDTDPNVKNTQGRTPIMILLARSQGNHFEPELKTLCLQAMVEFNNVDLDIKDARGRGLEDLAR